jgi:short-subunit dehydrogenase
VGKRKEKNISANDQLIKHNEMQKKILIIGGSSGLGKRLAEMYAAEGCLVGIVGRRENLLKELQKQYPEHISILSADITGSTITDELRNFIGKINGIDIFIITASTIEFNNELNDKKEIITVDTNVKSFVQLINIAWEYFRQKGKGHIVGVTSVAAVRGNKLAPAYHASKAFQSTYLESLRIKAKHEKNNIIITELVPGYMDTEMGKGNRLFWVASIEKAARQSKKAIQKKKAKAFITKRWWFYYQLCRFLPSFIYTRIINSKITLQQSIH